MKTDFGNRTHTYIAVGKDKSPFRQLSNLCIRNMNGAETNKDKAIIVDEVVSGSSGPVVPTPTSAYRTSPVVWSHSHPKMMQDLFLTIHDHKTIVARKYAYKLF